jgi:hypothetical protein
LFWQQQQQQQRWWSNKREEKRVCETTVRLTVIQLTLDHFSLTIDPFLLRRRLACWLPNFSVLLILSATLENNSYWLIFILKIVKKV